MSNDSVVIKKYKGNQEQATREFQEDAKTMAKNVYHPTSQSWAPGAYGCGSFLLALLLCFILIGIIIFIYMLIVKPDGTLTVTYEKKTEQILPNEKPCPQCAEQVKEAAKICRFCNYKFEEKQDS